MLRIMLFILVAPLLAHAGPVDNADLDIPDPYQTTTTTITEYLDQASWEAAIGMLTLTNPYGDLGADVIVTNQYAGIGTTYTDGDDITFPYGDSLDGMLLSGITRIHVQFNNLVYAVAVNYPGAVQIVGYLGGSVVFTSSEFGSSGAYLFAGIVSTDAFDSVEILDWVDDAVYIDDLNYNGGILGTTASDWTSVKALFQ